MASESATNKAVGVEGFTIGDGADLAEIAPARGAIVTRWRAGGREMLYLDEATLRDATKNVRGGVPVLFPSPGKLTNDAWARFGRNGAMKQHGFARTERWTPTPVADPVAAPRSIALRLDDDATTRAQFPWSFTSRLTYSVRGPLLRVAMTVENNSDASLGSMPFGFGLHPYFQVAQADKGKTRIATRARRAFDNVTKKTIDLPERDGASFIDLDVDEADVHLIDHGGSEATMTLADGRRIVVRGSSEITHWVVWTLRGKDFVCLEPWSCPGDALNTGDRLLHVVPRGSMTLWIEIEAQSAR